MLKRYLEIFTCCFAAVSTVSISAGNIFLGLTAVSLIFLFAGGKDITIGEFKNYYRAVGVFLCAMLLSALFSGHVMTGLKIWTEHWVWRFIPFVVMTMALCDRYKAERVLMFSLLGLTADIACVLYQGITGAVRAAGFFGHAMTFAGYSCIYLPALLILFFEKDILGSGRWLSGIIFALGCFALVFNGTRGAWLALAPLIFLILCRYIFKSKEFFVSAVIFLMIFGSFFGGSNRIVERLYSSVNVKTDASNIGRLYIWESSVKMFADHPVLGVGLGQYTRNYQEKYILDEAKDRTLGHAHNNFLHMLAENGLIGFVGFIVMLAYIVCSSAKNFYLTRSPYALMIMCSTVALILQGLTEYNFGNSAVMKEYWLVLGCLAVLDLSYRKAAGMPKGEE